MNVLPFIRNHPMVLGGVLAAGFATWLVVDAFPSQPAEVEPFSGELVTVHSPNVADPSTGDPAGLAQRNGNPVRPGVVTADQIARLHPGMSRVEVEELIGLPPAGLVQAVASADGRMTYRASYLANLDSLHETQMGSGNSAVPRSIIAIEFDASRPGHPLVKVHIPDPMS